MTVKNIVFDIGNVLVRWDPLPVVNTHLSTFENPKSFTEQVFKSDLWLDLNLGKITEQEIILKCHKMYNIDIPTLQHLMKQIKESLVPVQGSMELVKKLYHLDWPLYIITDNTFEIMQHLKEKYDIWHMFRGIVVSAEIGHRKPYKEIYRHLLENYKLNAEETVFFDDVKANVEGAQAVNMLAHQFTNSASCIKDLEALGIYLT